MKKVNSQEFVVFIHDKKARAHHLPDGITTVFRVAGDDTNLAKSVFFNNNKKKGTRHYIL